MHLRPEPSQILGHVVSSRGIEPVLTKVQDIQQWPHPHFAGALRSFLGLAGFYHRFIRRYAMIVAPLNKLLTIEPFEWTLEAQSAFTHLKEVLTLAPIIHLPDFTLLFREETDASGIAMGAVLS